MAYATHDVCPLVYPEPGSGAASFLADYLAFANVQAQDWGLMGDSRFTVLGRGVSVCAALNERSAQLFSGMGRLPIAWQFSSGGGSPVSSFAYRMATNGQGTVSQNTQARGNLLPCGGTFYQATNGGAGGGSQSLHFPDNHLGSKSLRSNAGGAKFWDKSRVLYADVWLVNNPGTGTAAVPANHDMIVEVKSQSGESSTWGGTSLGSATQSDVNLNTSTLTCRKFTFGPFTPDANPYYTLNVRGNTVAASGYGVVGQRFRIGTLAQQKGIAYTSLGLGGARIADLYADTTNGGSASDISGWGNMSNSDVVMAAYGFSGFMHLCGQNDASADLTIAQVKAAMRVCINRVRGAAGMVPYIIINNPFNPGLTSARRTLESTYVQAYTELCDEMPLVYFFNARRALEDYYGWNGTSHPGDVSSAGVIPAPLSYVGNWAPGVSYSVNDVVSINGVNGVALAVSGGAGTFTVGETVTQATSSATGIFQSLVSNVMYLQVLSGTFDGTNGLTGGTSGATRNVSSVRFDSLYARGGTGQGNDFNPRSYWACISAHTGAWTAKPGTQSNGADGHLEWNPKYVYCDPADPAHWHDDGAIAFADAVSLCQSQLFMARQDIPRLRGRFA